MSLWPWQNLERREEVAGEKVLRMAVLREGKGQEGWGVGEAPVQWGDLELIRLVR